MANKKLSELTEVTEITNDNTLVYLVDPTRAEGDRSIGINKTNLEAAIGGGSLPTNVVTTDTDQTIGGVKTFQETPILDGGLDMSGTGNRIIKSSTVGGALVLQNNDANSYFRISDIECFGVGEFWGFYQPNVNSYIAGNATDPLIIAGLENRVRIQTGLSDTPDAIVAGDVLTAVDSTGVAQWKAPTGKDNLTTANISGATNLDWNFTVHKLTATAAVTFSDINLPAHPKTITIYLTGEFAITAVTAWDLDLTDYDGSVWNRITIDYVESGFYSADLKVLS